MKVIASAGLKVPTEADPRKYITDNEAQEIEVSAYYLRRLADNELVEVPGAAPNPTGLAAAKSATASDKNN